MNESKKSRFLNFIQSLESIQLPTNITAKGETIIQQTRRNELRREGLKALIEDFNEIWGDKLFILETKDGIVVATELIDGKIFSWETKHTIKSLDYDPFYEAKVFEEDQKMKQVKKEEREKKEQERQTKLELKRREKLEELASRERHER